MKINWVVLGLTLFVSCTNGDKPANPESVDVMANAPKPMSVSIINSYPHDTSSFTEGFQLYKGDVYEGTGNYGSSRILKQELKTGKILKSSNNTASIFGEGITVLNDTVYQLSYKEHTLFVYTLPEFKKVKELRYDIPAEGWGMTTDGKELIVSDGTNNLYFFAPGTFQLLRTLNVTEGGVMAYAINELEYIDGFIYANQWQTSQIFKIDPSSGIIVGKADLTDLEKQAKSINQNAEAMNGIAYDNATKKIYITGKRWAHVYEVQFGN